jgi:hypothetical protein
MNLGRQVRTVFLPRVQEERPIYVPNWPTAPKKRELAEVASRTETSRRPAVKKEPPCSA